MIDENELEVETRTRHYYKSYGAIIEGYGPSMDPHVCGERNEQCVTIEEQRHVSPWRRTHIRKIVDGEVLESGLDE